MRDEWELMIAAWAFVIIGLVVGYYTDPIPCAHPAQTGCGYDSGYVAVVLGIVLVPLTLKRIAGHLNTRYSGRGS